MARKSKTTQSGQKRVPAEDKTPVTVTMAQYRSMIMAKLRADIAAKEAVLKATEVLDIDKLNDMKYWKAKYWKMKYWKMKYWKAGSVENPGDIVGNPAMQQKVEK